MHKNFLIVAALLGALSVTLGAFAAHRLKDLLDPPVLQVFETAVRYQFYHALGLLAVGILYMQFPVKQVQWAGSLFIAGIILFSGSLYILCAAKQLHLPLLWIGAITPLGGGCFIAGWLMMAYGISKKSTS